MMNRKIITVPWVEKRRLYVALSTIDSPGNARFVRISRAITPPRTKNENDVTMYRIPISLWSVVVTQRLTNARTVGYSGGSIVEVAAAISPASRGVRSGRPRDCHFTTSVRTRIATSPRGTSGTYRGTRGSYFRCLYDRA